MSLWWNCPNCGEKVDFTKKAASVFDEDGEADFSPSKGLFFHTLYCSNDKCGTNWIMSISEANTGDKSFFEKRLNKNLQNEEFKKERDDSEEEYLSTRDAIILKRLDRLEKNPESAILWKDIRRENPVAESLERSLKEMQQIREDDKEAKSWDDFIVEIESEKERKK